jgi:hypothetical protein
MADTVPDSWQPALGAVLATREARQLGGWLRQTGGRRDGGLPAARASGCARSS